MATTDLDRLNTMDRPRLVQGCAQPRCGRLSASTRFTPLPAPRTAH